VNNRFNEELQRQVNGTLPKGHIYGLGNPGIALLAAGVADLPIELKASRLTDKASIDYKNKHPFDLSEVNDLPKAINEPIAIFKSTKLNDDSKIILTELKDKNCNNFAAVLKIYKDPNSRSVNIEVNDVRSIYPKDRVEEIINWIKSGNKLTLWLDKTKAHNFVSTQSPYWIGSGNKEGLLINIINNF
jgi:hypothetical protein